MTTSKPNTNQQIKNCLLNVDINASVGKRILFDTNIVINEHAKICIIGPNGTGKTTILNKIYDELQKKQYDTSYMVYIQQDIIIDDNTDTILTYILKADIELYNNKMRYTYLIEKENITDEESVEINTLSTYLTITSWEKYYIKAHKVLHGLGILNVHRLIIEMSGGWKMRIAIAKALLLSPPILILDEPTNHLDLEGVIWITSYLENYRKTLIIVSHNMGFIERIASETWLLKDYRGIGQELLIVKGGYKNIIKVQSQMLEEMKNKMNKLELKVKTMRTKGEKKSVVDEYIKKQKQIEKLPDKMPTIIKTHFIFNNVKPIIGNAISLLNVNFGYTTDNILLNDIDFGINSESRVALVGPNGSGKTTLFNLCYGIIEPISGSIIRGRQIKIGMYNQDVISIFDNIAQTPIEYIMNNYNMEINDALKQLGLLGFKIREGQNPNTLSISELSGGFKARLALLKLILDEPNVLLLDEPTNHLDIETIQYLLESINNFNGGVMIITHDIEFIEKLNNCNIYEIYNKKLREYNDINDYINTIELYDSENEL